MLFIFSVLGIVGADQELVELGVTEVIFYVISSDDYMLNEHQYLFAYNCKRISIIVSVVCDKSALKEIICICH